MTTIEASSRAIQPSNNGGPALWTPNEGPQFDPDIIKAIQCPAQTAPVPRPA